jgi:tripartite-type tricarboxylate transporter receptor subunit TctC
MNSDSGLSKKPIQMILPSVVGSNIDVQARLVVEAARTFLGNTIEIVNIPGKGTVTGVIEALKYPADGCTLVFLIIPSIAIQPYLHGSPYTYQDLVPIANISETYIMLNCGIDSPWQTLQDLIDYSNRSPVKIGTSGNGLLPHLAGIELAKKAKADFSFVPYPSSDAAVDALIEKEIDAALFLSSAHRKNVRSLAIFEPDRKPSIPDVPTAKEQGYDVIGYVRDCIAVKKGTPQDIIDTLEEVFHKTVNTEKIEKAFFERKTEIKYLSSKDTFKLWASAVEAYRPVLDEIKRMKET